MVLAASKSDLLVLGPWYEPRSRNQEIRALRVDGRGAFFPRAFESVARHQHRAKLQIPTAETTTGCASSAAVSPVLLPKTADDYEALLPWRLTL